MVERCHITRGDHIKKPVPHNLNTLFRSPLYCSGSRRSKNITDEERDTIVKEVVIDQISPAVVGRNHAVSVTHVRTLVRNAGHKLPLKYKVTKEKVVKDRPK